MAFHGYLIAAEPRLADSRPHLAPAPMHFVFCSHCLLLPKETEQLSPCRFPSKLLLTLHIPGLRSLPLSRPTSIL